MWRSPRGQFIAALGISSVASAGLFAFGVWRSGGLAYQYLLWNLVLAWVPLLLALRLIVILRRKLWSSWEGLATSLVWLLFLPNSFYMISDFIHLKEAPREDVLYVATMFTAFICTGIVLGFSSLYLIHQRLCQRFTDRAAGIWIGVTLFLCSIAIYLGRDLRWNSWDILTNPGGVLFGIADRLQHPADYPQMLITIGAFFVLLAGLYNLLWRGAALVRSSK